MLYHLHPPEKFPPIIIFLKKTYRLVVFPVKISSGRRGRGKLIFKIFLTSEGSDFI